MAQRERLDELAARLFHVFSRTEYALKASGFSKGEGPAEANWDQFALAVDGLIANPPSKELQQAIDFIFGAPPKKQMIVGGLIAWQEVKPNTASHAGDLLTYVRRVRNNLFHGGKFNRHWFAPERSEALLRHSLVVLSAVVEAVPQVHKAYHG